MRLSFAEWLRNSNEAKPFRDAFELNGKMPLDYKLRVKCFDIIQKQCENAWEETKKELSK